MTTRGIEEISALAVLLLIGMVCSTVADRLSPRPATGTFEHGVQEIVLDVNTAHWAGLTLIDGVGVAIAKRIVEERERGGAFASADDLAARVPGVGGTLASLIWSHVADDD